MSDGNASDDSGRQKRTRFAAPSSTYEAMIKQTPGSPITADRDNINFQAVTLHDKLEKVVVCCAADLMTRRQNLHHRISSQHKMKNDNEYVPKPTHTKFELYVEK